MVKSEKTGAYSFREEIVNKRQSERFLAKK